MEYSSKFSKIMKSMARSPNDYQTIYYYKIYIKM
jgi:hypothetical protein